MSVKKRGRMQQPDEAASFADERSDIHDPLSRDLPIGDRNERVVALSDSPLARFTERTYAVPLDSLKR